jgi:hypothetical protein
LGREDQKAHEERMPTRPPIRALDELLRTACHVIEQYPNNLVEAGYGMFNARLRPTRTHQILDIGY